MNEIELQEKILDYMTTLYNANYTGTIDVIKTSNQYTLILGIPSYMSPTTITSNHTNDDDFLNYIYEEIRTRNYVRQYIYKVTRENDSRED